MFTVQTVSYTHLMLMIRDAVRDHDITDPLARQGQGFAVGIADQRVFIIFRQVRHLDSIVHDLPVRLVRNEIDRRAVFL